ncbi:hypothetical protein EVA_09868 [gut metagenome]|uniref:Uncharacterized protein n=1 Tax=gut metagenome TaxID=749906 RepID=J9G498_9ZZZZ
MANISLSQYRVSSPSADSSSMPLTAQPSIIKRVNLVLKRTSPPREIISCLIFCTTFIKMSVPIWGFAS